MIKNPEKVFLVFSIIFGLLFVFFTPPFQAPDEYNHFFRAYEVSQGHFISQRVEKSSLIEYSSNFVGFEDEASDFLVGNYMPRSLVHMMGDISTDIPSNTEIKQDPQKIFQYLFYKDADDSTIFANFPNTALYSPVPYMPQTLGIISGKLLSASYLSMFYLGRMFNLITYVALIFFSFKFLKAFKIPILLITLMPMSLFLAASNSPDALLIGVSFLLFSLSYALGNKYAQGNGYVFLFFLLSIFLGFSKMVFFLLPLSAIAFGGKRMKLGIIAFLLALSASVFWQHISKDLYIPLRIGVNPNMQLSSIVNDPLEYISTVKNTVIGNRNQIAGQIVGNLGWLDTPLDYNFVFFYLVLLGLAVLTGNEMKEKFRTKISYFAVGLLTCFLIITSLYLSWSPVGFPEVLGLVGRYFIPVLPFLLVLFYGLIPVKPSMVFDALVVVLIPVSLTYALYTVINRYYYMSDLNTMFVDIYSKLYNLFI